MILINYCKQPSERKGSKNQRRMLNFSDKRDYETASLQTCTSINSQKLFGLWICTDVKKESSPSRTVLK